MEDFDENELRDGIKSIVDGQFADIQAEIKKVKDPDIRQPLAMQVAQSWYLIGGALNTIPSIDLKGKIVEYYEDPEPFNIEDDK